MREIKFRAWDQVTGKIYPIKEIHFTFANGVTAHMEGRPYYEGKTLTTLKFDKLMQYTGLKDKNGKEIYEGDIVSKDGLDSRTEVSIVQWYAHKGGGWEPFLFSPYQAPEWRVIGNFYENRDLLKTP